MTAEIVILLLLLVANGVFAMAEIAVVTARRVRLEQRATQGDTRAARALELSRHPTSFLSTVQVGITLIGILAGAYGGATLAAPLEVWLRQFAWAAASADIIAFAAVVSVITYLSLVIGELVPKAIALSNPERIASAVATRVAAVARVASPLVVILDVSTRFVLRLLRIAPVQEGTVTEDEIRAMLKQATKTGDVDEVEQAIVEQVFRLGDRRVSSIMTPRPDIDWLDIHEGLEGVQKHLAVAKHPRLLFCDGSLDAVLGVVRSEDVLTHLLSHQQVDLRGMLKPPMFVPATLSVFKLVESFRASKMHVALVLDEFGAVEGIVTPSDVLQGLVGEMQSDTHAGEDPYITVRADGSWLVDGITPIEEVAQVVGLAPTPDDEAGSYQTLAGFVMTRLARVPQAGETFVNGGLRFEVIDMDGRRIDKVLISRTAVTDAPTAQGGHADE
ncbi:MAG: HlyC/CorC family transporter [Acidobacteria bacterium]|jgi:putative hemolysin|nr:HlyC/CorC family transporter [Acidobacteriota bacterium]